MTIIIDALVDRGWRLGPNAHLMSNLLDKEGAAELLAFARKLGLKSEWLQSFGAASEHFDLTAKRHARALELGAVLVDRRELVRIIRAKRAGWERDVA